MKHMKQDQVRVSLIPIGRTMLCIYIYIYMIYVCTESVQKGTNLILAKAATCGHLLWPPLAATCGHLLWRPLAATCSGGHLRPLEWLQVAAAEKRMLADTGGHLRPLEWLQVAAASGCKWLPLSWAENIGNFPLPAHGKFITFSVGGVLAM